MIDLQLRDGARRGDICDLLAAVDADTLAHLPAMAPEWRPGVVTSLAILRCVLRLYGDAAGAWSAAEYRAAWDRQLGPDSRRVTAPLGEVALFQPPISDPGKVKPLPVEHLAGFAAQEHVRKTSFGVEPQGALLGILGGTWRPFANFNVATARSGTLVLFPGDGTLGSEIRALTDGLLATAVRRDDPRRHFPWLTPRPSKPLAAATLAAPRLDIERAIRLTDTGLVVEPSNARWAQRDVIVDPSMATNLAGGSAGAPWRPLGATDASLVLHTVLAGTDDIARPGIMGAVEQWPLARVCVLHNTKQGTGGTDGYREWEIPIPRRTASVFARSPDRVAEASRRLLDAVERMREALGTALRAAGVTMHQRRARLRQASSAARQASVALLLKLADQDTTHRLMRAQAEQAFIAATAMASPLQRARGEGLLTHLLRQRLPLAEEPESLMTTEDPPLIRRAHAAITGADAGLSAADRAKLRTAVPGRLSLAVTAVVLAASRSGEALAGSEGEAWETAVLALGSLRAKGQPMGRALAASRYPEMRAQQLLNARGGALRAQVRSALRWLTAHGVTSVRLGDVLGLMLADARDDPAALAHARRVIALGFVAARNSPPDDDATAA